MEMDLDRIIQKYSQNPTLAIETHTQFDDAKSFVDEVFAAAGNVDAIMPMVEEVTTERIFAEPEELLPSASLATSQEIAEQETPNEVLLHESAPENSPNEIVEEVFQLSNMVFEAPTSEFEIHEVPETVPAEDHELLKDISSIPDRLAFKIGDVADIVGVKQYVLRYWETEFEALKPKKSRQNQRMYSRKDVENIMLIKKLLYKDKFSIEGARKALKNLKTQVKETKKWDQVADKYEAAILQLKDLKLDLSEFRQAVI